MTRRKYPWLVEAAPAGGRARWKGVAPKERANHATAAAKARWKRRSAAERSEAMRQLVLRRWAKRRRRG